MEVRPDILEKLICSVCGEYLSCVPIRMKKDGAALCGRCCDPEDESTLRITPYEELAHMVVFPCAFNKHGCTETLYMTEMQDHEDGCMYRQYVCPVTDSGQCDWSGCRKDILDHCTQQHQDIVLQDPCTLQHQIRESNHKTFLLAAFEMLFIIHCKVCLTSMNIYHSVRLIGKSVLARKYIYKLKVLNDKDTLTRRRDVVPQGSMALQEDTSVHVNIDNMLKFLGDFKDISFKIIVGRRCVKCNKCRINSTWTTDNGWCCVRCGPARQMCKSRAKGCTYMDGNMKVSKHEVFFCQYGTGCKICNDRVSSPRESHYLTEHVDVTYEAGEIWAAQVVEEFKMFITTSDVGRLFCRYNLSDVQFTLSIWSPLHTQQLANYNCVVTLRNPSVGYAVRETLPLTYGTQQDWILGLRKEVFLMYVSNNEFDIKIELIKN